MVPQAIGLLEEALGGTSHSAAQQRVALEIIKAAANIRRYDDDTGQSELGKAIAELDARNEV